MSSPFVFVNYENPAQSKDRAKRQIISTHIGRFYRNRSGPSQRKEQRKDHRVRKDASNYFPTDVSAEAGLIYASPHRNATGRDSRHTFLQWQHIPRPHKGLDTPSTPPHDLGSLTQVLDYHLKQQKGRQTEEEEELQKGTPPRPDRQPGPLSVIGQGRVDPFAEFAVEEDYSQIHLGIDYGKSNLAIFQRFY